jgi:hypothetical protein
MEVSTSEKCSTPRSRSLNARDLNLLDIYRATQRTLPIDVWARLNDAGVIVR